jgi:hypothetical protein
MLPPPVSPLVAVGLSYVSELNIPLTPEQTAEIRAVLIRYLDGLISYRDCISIFVPLTGTSQPIDRLEAILSAPDGPDPFPSRRDARAKTWPWRPYEDQRLLAGIHRFGLGNWDPVARVVGTGRTKAQCCQRWNRGLNPAIRKERWSESQDERLIELVAQYGEKSWTRISRELGNRCDVQCRYRYKQLQKGPGFAAQLESAIQKDDPIDVGKVPQVQNPRPLGQMIPQIPLTVMGQGCCDQLMVHFPLLPLEIPMAATVPPKNTPGRVVLPRLRQTIKIVPSQGTIVSIELTKLEG